MVCFWRRRHTEMRTTSATSTDLVHGQSSSGQQSRAQRSWQAHQHRCALQSSTTLTCMAEAGVSELINLDLQHSKWPGTPCSADNAIPLSILDPIKGSSHLYLNCILALYSTENYSSLPKKSRWVSFILHQHRNGVMYGLWNSCKSTEQPSFSTLFSMIFCIWTL